VLNLCDLAKYSIVTPKQRKIEMTDFIFQPKSFHKGGQLSAATQGKIVLAFSPGATVKIGRSEFADEQDLIQYIKSEFGISGGSDTTLQMKVSRRGKYQRLDTNGKPIFTFSDPVLDLITNSGGQLKIGEKIHDLKSIREANLQRPADDPQFDDPQRPPNVLEFEENGARLRMTAWRDNDIVRWSMGTKIETFNSKFEAAQIASQYGDPILDDGVGATICGIVKSDSDQDVEDDFVDETESGFGFNIGFSFGFAPYSSIRSSCAVVWQGQEIRGFVQAGNGCPNWLEAPPVASVPPLSLWKQVAGSLKYVSAAADGSVWGVNSDDKIFRRNNEAGVWEQIGGELKQISVGSRDNIWGVNSDDDIFQWNGSGWNQIAGALKYVSAAADGSVWGVNSDDKIFRRDNAAGVWERISGELKQVSVGSSGNIWGVNSDDEIFQWNGSGWDEIAGALKYVSVAADDSVWGVNSDDKIFRRISGGVWDENRGELKQIAIGSRSKIWGVNSDDDIYMKKTNTP
jgi:hypothetical protein